MTGAYIAVDWGTTNRRAYLMAEDGAVLDTSGDERGVLALAAEDYPDELRALRSRFGQLPILAAGMVGSTHGWKEAPYVAAPADLESLTFSIITVPGENARIVPGVSLRDGGRADVMRGEEIQVLGAIAVGAAPASALFCQPGTHNKWIVTVDSRITDFATAMTGELFALVRDHGILSGMLDGEVRSGPAFSAGVARGLGARDLAVALFEVRAAVLLGSLPPADAASFASGLLIGSDVGARSDLAQQEVYLLATGSLADLYSGAVAAAGGRAVALDSRASFAAGIHQIWERTL
jgi:2-dehydro-3-deoxygalactonokinase